jgi:hypothetical protein
MGRNFYFYRQYVSRECHVGKMDQLDLIAICTFFRSELFELKLYQDKRDYLKMVKRSIKTEDQISHFDDLPNVLMAIYDIINNRSEDKLFLLTDYQESDIINNSNVFSSDVLTEYQGTYDFKKHISYCTNPNQKECGGLRYSTNTDYT